MLKIRSLSVVLLLAVFLGGCQNNHVTALKDATSIDVYRWNSETLVATIEDQEFIESLEDELDGAETQGTETIDWEGPNYRLIFKAGDNVLHEIGYCMDMQNFEAGREGGRYWKPEKLYEVETEVPFE